MSELQALLDQLAALGPLPRPDDPAFADPSDGNPGFAEYRLDWWRAHDAIQAQVRLLRAKGDRGPILDRNEERVEVAVYSDDGPTPERASKSSAHEVLVYEGDQRRYVQRFTDSEPLDRYFRREELDKHSYRNNARLYAAGCMLRSGWRAAGLEPRVVGSYEPATPTTQKAPGIQGFRNAQLDALAAVQDSLNAVSHHFRQCVLSVACLGWSAQQYARWSGSAGSRASVEGLLCLRYGLTDLAHHLEIERRMQR